MLTFKIHSHIKKKILFCRAFIILFLGIGVKGKRVGGCCASLHTSRESEL